MYHFKLVVHEQVAEATKVDSISKAVECGFSKGHEQVDSFPKTASNRKRLKGQTYYVSARIIVQLD